MTDGSSTAEEQWNEVFDSDGGDSSDGEGTRRCPGKEAIKWQNKAVYIQAKQGSPIFGALSLRAEDDTCFIVWQPTDDPTQVNFF